MKINADAIRELAEILEETGLTEIEVAQGEQVIRVSRGGGSGGVVHHMPSDPTVPQKANLQPPQVVAGDAPGAVTSPMVGTVYLQPEPGAPSFVGKGDSVSAGQTLLIIEAMKVMNPIKADRSGIVTQILVDSGQPVEFGDVLMVIE